MVKKTAKKKEKKQIDSAVVHVQSSFNNTIVSVSDESGNVIAWSSAGLHGFKGARRSTPFAAKVTAEHAIQKALEFGVKEVAIHIKGPGAGRESALRAVAAEELKVTRISDVTPVPHNGCRPPKQRRV